jgi:23S rRNA (adenine2503-C2)-methyltransferase
MGMGEPLLNLPSVAAAYKLLNEDLGLSGRAITVSTVGVPNTIRKLAALKLPLTLAVSIHAPNQQLREQLIPSAKVYPIGALMVVSLRRGGCFLVGLVGVVVGWGSL